ncbi:MAG TPA: hypothetical protein VLS89_09150, partial [Candidatus Nanopelagicales bacterium]|nr:hypothetical protein [Candidatus Nanopelagicales bacterium]
VGSMVGGLGLEQVKAGRVLVLGGVSLGAGLAARALLPAGLAGRPVGALVVLGAFGAAFAAAAPGLGLIRLRSLLRRR